MRHILMLKNTPILERNGYKLKILNLRLLPPSIRSEKIEYDNFVYSWLDTRSMNIGRTNSKNILRALHLPQNSIHVIARSFHIK